MTPLLDAHAALLRDGALQFDLPVAPPEPPPLRPWAWHQPFGAIPEGVVWFAAGLLLVVALAAAALRVRARPLVIDASPAVSPEAGPEPPQVRLALADGDQLAADGRFLEAVRALLGSGLGFIADHHPDSLPPTATSRDIAGDLALPEGLRTAFARIAATVERGLFAGEPVGRADYDACRQVFTASAMAGPG